MAEPEVIIQARKDIQPSLKKYNKKSWSDHSDSLQNLMKEAKDMNHLNELLDLLIPQTKRLMDSVKKNTKKSSLWYTLDEELIRLNHIQAYLEQDNEISNRILQKLREIYTYAEVERALTKAVL